MAAVSAGRDRGIGKSAVCPGTGGPVVASPATATESPRRVPLTSGAVRGASTPNEIGERDAARLSWPREEVDRRLQEIMKAIHRACRETAAAYGVPGNYVHGANIAGFTKVADAMMDQGVV